MLWMSLELIKHYISKYSAMAASDWNGLNFKPLQSYTENILSLFNPALKLFSDLASLKFIGSLLELS